MRALLRARDHLAKVYRAAYQVREDIDLAERNAACAVAVLGADDPLTAIVLSRVEMPIASRA